MTADELKAKIAKRLETDPRLRRLRKRIAEGKATALDSFNYSRICSEIMSAELEDAVLELDDREGVCTELLHDRYDDTNAAAAEIQQQLDRRKGLWIRPRKPAFPAERVQKIAHSLVEPGIPDEKIVRRAGSTATVSMSFHDDFVREQASFRSRAGLKCYITRTAVGGCCPWCSDVAGRYEYGEEPDDIYRRHDNCDCTVTFENGRQRQDVWSKRTWEVPGKDAGAAEPTVLTAEQAAEIEAKHQPTVLTNEHGKRIIKLSINLFSPSDGVYLDAFSIEEEPGYEDVHLHGSPTSVQIRRDGKLVNVSAQEFALILRANGYRGGDIRLCSCSTGQGEDSFAQQLSKVLGCRVKAPDSDLFYIPEDGVMFVGSCFSNTGKWRVFSKGDEVT